MGGYKHSVDSSNFTGGHTTQVFHQQPYIQKINRDTFRVEVDSIQCPDSRNLLCIYICIYIRMMQVSTECLHHTGWMVDPVDYVIYRSNPGALINHPSCCDNKLKDKEILSIRKTAGVITMNTGLHHVLLSLLPPANSPV